ncbi:MAG: MBL fold metallo-hydrolase, partial [Clostridia bacterium]|nr:MBL fold metallo-hydrolase [Clostridia bacterium]
MLPIGGTYTMTAQEAKELVKILSPAAAIPTHYGTVVGKPSDYDTFADGLDCAVKKLVF